MNELTIDAICERWSGRDRPLFKGALLDDESGCCCAQGDILRVSGRSDDELRNMPQRFADTEVARLLGISRAHAILLRHVNDRHDGCPQDVLQRPERILGNQAPLVLAFWRLLDAMNDEQWAAVRNAPRDEAWDVARDAAQSAAWDAAWDAALAEAWDAALDAAQGATQGVTRDAAWDAARRVPLSAARDVDVARRFAAREATWTAALNAALSEAWGATWTASRDAARATTGAVNEILGAAVMRREGRPFFFLPLFGIAEPDALLGGRRRDDR